MVNYDCCDRWLPEAPVSSRIDSLKRSCGGAVGVGLQPSIVGINCVGAGIARGKAAARVMARAKDRR